MHICEVDAVSTEHTRMLGVTARTATGLNIMSLGEPDSLASLESQLRHLYSSKTPITDTKAMSADPKARTLGLSTESPCD